MANERSKTVVHEIEPGIVGRFVLTAKDDFGDAECGVDYRAGELPTEGVRFGLDWAYVKAGLGAWPLRIEFTDGESPVVFCIGENARYVVMPVRI